MEILFKNPLYLYALSLIAVPIIIHLFNFKRYKTIYFSNISFLESAKNRSKSTSQLKHLLVLISRILFIISLVLVFAQPYIPKNKNQKIENNYTVSIYIDNSFSSANENTNGKILDIAKNKAQKIASAFSKSTKFLLLTNDLLPSNNRFVDYDQLLNSISEINISPQNINIDKLIDLNKDFATNPKNNRLFIISDFQNNFIQNSIKNDSISNVSLIPIEVSAKNNLSIDSCWFETPFRKINSEEKLFVKIKSYSTEQNTEIPLKLFINDSLRAIQSFNIEPLETKTIELNYKNTLTGIYNAKIEIDDYPISFDNSLFFSYLINKNINILLISDNKTNYLEKLYSTEPYFIVDKQNSKNVSYSKLNDYNLIILDNIIDFTSGLTNQLMKFYKNGGNLVLIPEVKPQYIDIYNTFLKNFAIEFLTTDSTTKKITEINLKSNIFENIFLKNNNKTNLSQISNHYKIGNYTSSDVLLKLENNDIAILRKYEKGYMYIFNFNASTSENISFVKSPIMLPLFYNIAFNSLKNNQLYYNFSEKNLVLNYNLPQNITIKNKNLEFIPEINKVQNISTIEIPNVITEANNYQITSDNNIINSLSINYSRYESNLNFKNLPDLQKIIDDNNLKTWTIFAQNSDHLTQEIETSSKGKQLWYYFLISAIIFITLEIILLRFFDKNNLPF